MILESEYLAALEVVELYKEQLRNASIRSCDLRIHQEVRRNYPNSWIYWVTEINGNDILIRTTEDLKDPKYDDYWVNISELRLLII